MTMMNSIIIDDQITSFGNDDDDDVLTKCVTLSHNVLHISITILMLMIDMLDDSVRCYCGMSWDNKSITARP